MGDYAGDASHGSWGQDGREDSTVLEKPHPHVFPSHKVVIVYGLEGGIRG